ncbi:FAD-binding oxidoreductase [Seongchinamella sediminis]|uniref:FAD-binding oxidoreductase n=2 Tax=Halieaceae TaxID=1706372 RepID=A0A2N5X610_9GAMM|nr:MULTISPECIES: FAD-binding oxidoreductase [Halieaceae]PLW69911.1 FAD-binding oxidoreductase [Pseudohalioglobus lutimaris]RLQ20553.1 FAD-binding oxidoreductase [Seongchinamella sediminis]
METFDIIIVGAGMAGASIAGELSGQARVLLLEREEQPGYHSTGRSAAAFIPSYGHDNPSLSLLTKCSLDFLLDPSEIFRTKTLLHRRGLLVLCAPGEEAAMDQEWSSLQQSIPTIFRADTDFIRRQLPIVNDDYAATGWYEPDVFDMDVHALHEGYLRALRERGGRLLSNVAISGLERRGAAWCVETPDASYSAPLLVNAAGAWADEVAALAGVDGIGLTPLRRTAVLLDPPAGCDVSGWPLVMASDGSFYLKPDAGLILASPADEHPSRACDAQPEELDIAYAVHYAQQALQLEVRQVKHSWAGLRNFVADRTPVIGFAPDSEGFFWLAGQGGHGIQTAPAAARLAASLLLGSGLPVDLEQVGFDPAWVSPRRLEGLETVTKKSHPQTNFAQ